MPREQRFTFLVDRRERSAIRELAERLQRSESDAVRYVVREAVQELARIEPTVTSTTPEPARVAE